MRGVFIASHQPSLYIARLPMVSKYCWVCRSGADSLISESAKVDPVQRFLLDAVDPGRRRDASDVEIVAATSVTWVNCEADRRGRGSARASGSTIGLRVPPRCEPTCLPHLNGVFPAHAHAAE